MAKKVTISNKDLKKPDQIQAFQERVITYIYKNKKKLSLFLGLFVLVLFLSGGYYYYGLQCEKKALDMYSAAFNSYNTITGNGQDNKGVNADSVALFEELIAKHPRSNAAVFALYNLGNIYFTLNELDKSIDAYDRFLAKSSKDTELTSLAYYGLGYCYEGKKDYTKALEAFKKSTSHGAGEAYQGMNYQNIARIYEEMNNRNEATTYYKRALDLTSDPVIEKLIQRKISMLTYMNK